MKVTRCYKCNRDIMCQHKSICNCCYDVCNCISKSNKISIVIVSVFIICVTLIILFA